MLDLASQYIHDNQKEKSDAIIENVVKRYPNGFYVTKKKEANNKKAKRVRTFIGCIYECPVIYNKFQIKRSLLYRRYG